MKILYSLLQLLFIYCLITLVLYFITDRSIFAPPKRTYTNLPNLIKVSTADNREIAAIYLSPTNAKYVILYSHGNAEDLGMIYPILQTFVSWGFAVISYDYHGYGTSEGSPSESATYLDITAAYNYLIQKKNFKPENIIVFGRSVGTGPSIELATHKQVAAVILESPFISAYRVVTYFPIFIFDKYKNLSKINKINVPILFIHGTLDAVIPIWHSKKLYETYNGTKSFYWAENAGHNDLEYVMSDKYKKVIMDFILSIEN